MKLEFTATCMRRPDVWREALGSFTAHLQSVEVRACTLFVNIDPMPEDGQSHDIVEIAEGVFGNVVVNTPETANFAAAVKWCWAQPVGDYFLHLEDDWKLQSDIDANDMMETMRTDQELSVLNLRAYNHNDERICLAPGLWRTDHARAIGTRMRTDANPERQLRKAMPNNPHGGLHVGYKGKQYPGRIVIFDLGRPWMKENGLQREGQRSFTRWARIRQKQMT